MIAVSASARAAISIPDISSFQSGKEAVNILDGEPATFWHIHFAGGDAKPPHCVVLQVNGPIAGLHYRAWTGGNGNGQVKAHAISNSDDGKTWEPIVTEFESTAIVRFILSSTPKTCSVTGVASRNAWAYFTLE